ncbi:MAG: DUF721 domain-containing protein [Deltaproteobacteria bacterium]|nr:DUF721 domain-containing protein [Deltaproteobacteria bacterium]MBI5810115.1 DUF721 domain-containing protein [Deltaproteobacteria bacterium]
MSPKSSPYQRPPFSGRQANNRFGPATAASVIGTLRIPGIDAKLKEYTLRKLWREAVGETIARKAHPLRLIGKTLYCAVSSSAWMTELNYQKGALMEKLNEKLGKASISVIIFKYGQVSYREEGRERAPLKAREMTEDERDFIEKTVRPVKDESIRAVIRRAMEKAKS